MNGMAVLCSHVMSCHVMSCHVSCVMCHVPCAMCHIMCVLRPMNGMAVLCSHVWVFPSSLCCCIYGIPVTVMYAEVIMVIALAMTVPHQDGDGKVSYMHDMY